MDNEDLLFTNVFIKEVETDDIPREKKEQFRQYHEKNIRDQDVGILNRKNSRSSLRDESSNHQKQIPKTEKIEKTTIVNIDSSNRDVNKYPEQSEFEVFLGKTFFNVKKIKLVSTEFPNTDQVIKDTPIQLKNNMITWQNDEDVDLNFYKNVTINTVEPDTVDITVPGHGFPINSTLDILIYNSKLNSDTDYTYIIDGYSRSTVIDVNTFRILRDSGIPDQGTASVNLGYPQYSVNFTPGNYTATSLTEEMKTQLNKIKRRNGKGQFHYFDVKISLDTDVLTFDSVITKQLTNNPLSTTAGSTTITVHSNNHGFKTGDRVKMINIKNTAGIPGSVLNGDFIISMIDFNTFTYEIITKAIDTVDGGGNTVLTGSNAPFRILFDTADTIIQYNIGFPDEDSSEAIGSPNSITTQTLKISDAMIEGNELKLVTPVEHGLSVATVVNITSISIDNPVKITTSTPHGIALPINITIRGTNSYPSIDGDYTVTPSGPTTFVIPGVDLIRGGSSGQIIYGGDKIKILNFRSVPAIVNENSFFIESVSSLYSINILFQCEYIEPSSFERALISTSQIFVNQPNHGFNRLSTITGSSIDSAFCKTYLSNVFSGRRVVNSPVIDGPSNTNSLDITVKDHGLETSDLITLSNSTTLPAVDNVYNVQIVSKDILRVNFTHSTFADGTAIVSYGDKITIIDSKSQPRIDGTYTVDNQRIINDISLGSITSSITTTTANDWSVGDTISITNTDSTPPIDGVYQIQSVVNGYTFIIAIQEDIVSPGTNGTVINNSRFKIYTGFQITSPGINSGLITRKNEILLYRVEGENQGGDKIGGLPINVINGVPYPIGKLIDINNYMIRVRGGYANRINTAGGSNIKISSLTKGLRSIQANTDTGDTSGSLFRSISLEGVNYVFLTSPGIECVLNSAGISNVFAKILLNESPGIVMFNSFVSTPQIFDYPIAKMDTMKLSVLTPDGYSFNFNDTNYSISVEVTELVDQPGDSYISSRTGGTEFDYQRQKTNNNQFSSSRDQQDLRQKQHVGARSGGGR